MLSYILYYWLVSGITLNLLNLIFYKDIVKNIKFLLPNYSSDGFLWKFYIATCYILISFVISPFVLPKRIFNVITKGSLFTKPIDLDGNIIELEPDLPPEDINDYIDTFNQVIIESISKDGTILNFIKPLLIDWTLSERNLYVAKLTFDNDMSFYYYYNVPEVYDFKLTDERVKSSLELLLYEIFVNPINIEKDEQDLLYWAIQGSFADRVLIEQTQNDPK